MTVPLTDLDEGCDLERGSCSRDAQVRVDRATWEDSRQIRR